MFEGAQSLEGNSKFQVSEDANVMGGRFVLVVKNVLNLGLKAKSRYIVQGHLYKEKQYMVHYTDTLRASSVCIILSVSAVNGSRIFSHDFNQAYVQSKDKFTRKIFIFPKKEDLEILGITTEDEM